MNVKEVKDFYEIDVYGLKENYHIIYEKICQVEPLFNENYQLIGEKEGEILEEVSVYEETGSLIKKSSYIIGKDVNNVAEALGIISHQYVNKLSA